jgi:hypothetical protein
MQGGVQQRPPPLRISSVSPMGWRALRRLLGLAALVGITAVASSGIAVSAQTASVAKVTPRGVGGVKIGATFTKLRQRHLVGRLHRGCELAPNTRSARLLAPLKGSVDFTLKNPRRVTDVLVRGGARARGVGIGATIADIQNAFPSAIIDHSTEQTFGLTLVRIPRNGGGRIQFAVPLNTHRVNLIGVPFIAFCE